MEILKKSGGEENVKRGRACRSNDKCGHVSQHLHIAMGLIPCPRHMPCFPVILRPLLFFPLKLPYNSTQQEKGGGKKKKEKEERERERENLQKCLWPVREKQHLLHLRSDHMVCSSPSVQWLNSSSCLVAPRSEHRVLWVYREEGYGHTDIVDETCLSDRNQEMVARSTLWRAPPGCTLSLWVNREKVRTQGDVFCNARQS